VGREGERGGWEKGDRRAPGLPERGRSGESRSRRRPALEREPRSEEKFYNKLTRHAW
jgi:hypothetical protein